jgi:hypothetical protein
MAAIVQELNAEQQSYQRALTDLEAAIDFIGEASKKIGDVAKAIKLTAKAIASVGQDRRRVARWEGVTKRLPTPLSLPTFVCPIPNRRCNARTRAAITPYRRSPSTSGFTTVRSVEQWGGGKRGDVALQDLTLIPLRRCRLSGRSSCCRRSMRCCGTRRGSETPARCASSG